ncbi:MAG: hypothetical protein J7578_07375 [Chitinophagaceae bacterium]|nr:hypothetical protein [Chitinophagaceae bacterium]
MKRFLLPVLLGALFITSCKKDDKPQEVVQIQQIDTDNGAKFHFTYNDNNQVTKMEVSYQTIPVGYINFNYNNGLPVSAESYYKEALDQDFKLETGFKFATSGQNIAYAAMVDYNADGSIDEESRDTTYFSFNSANRIASIKYGFNNDPFTIGWDNNNNLKLTTVTETNGDYRYTTSYEHSYDNNVNPFRYGLGAMILAIEFYELETADQIWSANNSLSMKTTQKNERMGNGQVLGTSYRYDNTTRSFTLDENGLPKTCKLIRATKLVSESGSEDNDSYETTFTYTCVKKQL